MTLALTLFPTILLSLTFRVIAGPVFERSNPVTLPLTQHSTVSAANSPVNIVQQDKARIQDLVSRISGGGNTHSRTARATAPVPITNQLVYFSATVGVGSPATNYELLIDTGSSNTWVGAGQKYRPSSTTRLTLDTVEVTYGSGSFSGEEVIDQLNFTSGSDLVIPRQSIGAALTSQGFDGIDGILGIGPTGLTEGTLFPELTKTIPTVTDSLCAAKDIDSYKIGIYFEPPTSGNSNPDGTMTFCGTDNSKTTSEIIYTPITSTSPASHYWGIEQTVNYGGAPILNNAAGIVDTGTSLVYLQTDAFDAYKTATGAVLDSATGLLSITADQFSKLQDLDFLIGDTTFPLVPDAQLFPRAHNTDIGGTQDGYYLIVADMGSTGTTELDFINGYAFLERYYSVYDTGNQQVGFATTAFTMASVNQ